MTADDSSTNTGSASSQRKTLLAILVCLMCLLCLLLGFFTGFLLNKESPTFISKGVSPPSQQIVRINGHEIVADASSDIIVEGENETVGPVVSRTVDRNGTTKGAGVTTTEKGVADTWGSLPEINLDDGSIMGGGFSWRFEGMKADNTIWLYAFAGALALAGGVLLYFGIRHMAYVAFALAGTSLAVAFLKEEYPFVLLILILAMVGAGIYFLYDQWKKKNREISLTAVATGIEHSPPEVQKIVKANIATAAGTALKTVKNTITDVKDKISGLNTQQK